PLTGPVADRPSEPPAETNGASREDPWRGDASLYRPEALAAHRAGGRVRRRSRWLDGAVDGRGPGRLGFYALLALGIVAAAAGLSIPVEDRVTGDAVIRQAPETSARGAGAPVLVEARMPAARRSDVALGQRLAVTFSEPGVPGFEARITGVSAPSPDAGADGHILVLARAEVSPPPSAAELRVGVRGRASVHVASTSLLAYLVPSMGEPPGGSP
ncbi:MAG: hypothetical protein AAGF23_05900, partial [Acidobacteriota bacterium]